MSDLRAHVEVSSNFPVCPSYVSIFRKGTKKKTRLRAEKNGTLLEVGDGSKTCGHWWPHSATCVEFRIEGVVKFFRHSEEHDWTSSDGLEILSWTRRESRSGDISRTPSRKSRNSLSGSPNISRFRMTILPVDGLDHQHRSQLSCMGLRLCFHAEVGRVLVSSRMFVDGEVVIYSRVTTFNVEQDGEVFALLDPAHPSCCYVLVPRLRKLYYNKVTFSHIDPVGSGDLWYLVNHSSRPNVEVMLRDSGIQFRAKRTIQPNEAIVWMYPPSFFGKDEKAVDLPVNIIPDSTILPRE